MISSLLSHNYCNRLIIINHFKYILNSIGSWLASIYITTELFTLVKVGEKERIRDVVLNQLRSSFGVNVLMVCSFQNDKPAKLSEIRLCLNPSLEFIDCPISGNKNDYQQFSNSFYHQNIYHNPVCKSSLPWLYQSPICYNQSSILLFYNAPCPEELIFPDFN
uniref:Uncharacterized protein n=1 Tax=Schistosoma haematobium TaxID=6185 RepID=A0A095A8P6_SCHHA